MRFRRFEGERVALSDFQAEAHHRLVDGPDLLDVEAPVREPLAVEHEQVLEDARRRRHRRHEGRVDALSNLSRSEIGAAFEERKAVRVEEVSVTRGKVQLAEANAVEDEAEERQRAAPKPRNRRSIVSG